MTRPDLEQIAFDAYVKIEELPLPHTDAICNIISKAIRDANAGIIAELENYRSIAESMGAPIAKSEKESLTIQLNEALLLVEHLEYENERLKGLINIRDTKIIRLAKNAPIV